MFKARHKSKTMMAGAAFSIGKLRITCFSSGAGSGFIANNHSIALRIQFHTFRYYTAGDLETCVEDKILPDVLEKKGHLCAMKCGHHGSSGSTSRKFLKQSRPTVALISCGNSAYCHPDDEVIGNLYQVPSLQQLYLTNCFYNRAGINPSYDDDLPDEIERYNAELKKRKKDSEQDLARRKAGVPKAVARKLFGVAAGDDNHIGTIIISISENDVRSAAGHSFEVGHYNRYTNGWLWAKHTCGVGMEEGTLPSRAGLVNIASLNTNMPNGRWLHETTKDREIAPFSMLTKPPGEKVEKALWSDEERKFAVEDEIDSEPEDEDDGDYEPGPKKQGKRE